MQQTDGKIIAVGITNSKVSWNISFEHMEYLAGAPTDVRGLSLIDCTLMWCAFGGLDTGRGPALLWRPKALGLP